MTDPSAIKAGIEDLLGAEVVDLRFESGALVGVQLAGQEEMLSLADIAAAAGIAAPPDTPPVAESEAAKFLTDLLERLAALGDDPGEEALGQIDDLLDALATVLDLPSALAPTPTELARLGAGALTANAQPADQMKALLADLSRQLTVGIDGEPGRAQEVGTKLGSLLAALHESDAGSDLMTKLGFSTEGEALDPELEAQIAALLAKAPARPATAAGDPRLTQTIVEGETATAETETASLDDAVRPTARELPDRRAPTQVAAIVQADSHDNQPLAAEIAAQTGTRIEMAPVAKPVIAGYQTSQQQINLPQIAFEIVRQVHQGNTQFQIRLDPPELGRIDVRMDIDQAGNVNARLTVEKAETLDLMQRDQRVLERALAQAGLDGAKTNLEFSLRQNPFAQQDQGRQGGSAQPLFDLEASGADEEPIAPAVTLYRGSVGARGVNILV